MFKSRGAAGGLGTLLDIAPRPRRQRQRRTRYGGEDPPRSRAAPSFEVGLRRALGARSSRRHRDGHRGHGQGPRRDVGESP